MLFFLYSQLSTFLVRTFSFSFFLLPVSGSLVVVVALYGADPGCRKSNFFFQISNNLRTKWLSCPLPLLWPPPPPPLLSPVLSGPLSPPPRAVAYGLFCPLGSLETGFSCRVSALMCVSVSPFSYDVLTFCFRRMKLLWRLCRRRMLLLSCLRALICGFLLLRSCAGRATSVRSWFRAGVGWREFRAHIGVVELGGLVLLRSAARWRVSRVVLVAPASGRAMAAAASIMTRCLVLVW